jgi:hypothetical protein
MSPALQTTTHKPVKNTGKSREDFPLTELDQLLHAIIKVNPFIALKILKGESWKEVLKRLQTAGFCMSHDADTLKNKVTASHMG